MYTHPGTGEHKVTLKGDDGHDGHDGPDGDDDTQTKSFNSYNPSTHKSGKSFPFEIQWSLPMTNSALRQYCHRIAFTEFDNT